ncbi:MAG: rod shape-determining protein MreC [Ruminococcaceae bacterium]|nr:rod shape-determining protein MreC [Oscillospiraceae bacterium]
MKKKVNILLLVVTLIIFVLMGVSFATRDSVESGNLVGTVLRPFQQFFSGIGNGIRGGFTFLGDMKEFQAENIELKDQVAALQAKVRELESYKQENDRLRSLLELSTAESDLDMVVSKVIAKEPGNWFYSFTVDKGADDGIAIDDPVISGQGLVGRVVELGDHWAKVLTIIDSDSSVGALLSRTQDFAIVDGELSLADEGKCKMSYVTKGANIVLGDEVVTSGLGGVYPEGLLIGTVAEIKSDSLGYSQYALIDTAVDFERIREVMVVRNR